MINITTNIENLNHRSMAAFSLAQHVPKSMHSAIFDTLDDVHESDVLSVIVNHLINADLDDDNLRKVYDAALKLGDHALADLVFHGLGQGLAAATQRIVDQQRFKNLPASDQA